MEPNLSSVRTRRAQLAKQIKQLQDEDEELAIAERALTRLAVGTSAISSMSSVSEPTKINGATHETPVTHRDLVIATLKHRADPWVPGSKALLDEISETHGLAIQRNSFLPLLSNLKKEGVITRDVAKRIALTERI
jgi:hypothetical protein